MVLCYLPQGPPLCRVAVEVHGYDGFCLGGYGFEDEVRVNVVGVRLYIDEDGLGPLV